MFLLNAAIEIQRKHQADKPSKEEIFNYRNQIILPYDEQTIP